MVCVSLPRVDCLSRRQENKGEGSLEYASIVLLYLKINAQQKLTHTRIIIA